MRASPTVKGAGPSGGVAAGRRNKESFFDNKQRALIARALEHKRRKLVFCTSDARQTGRVLVLKMVNRYQSAATDASAAPCVQIAGNVPEPIVDDNKDNDGDESMESAAARKQKAMGRSPFNSSRTACCKEKLESKRSGRMQQC